MSVRNHSERLDATQLLHREDKQMHDYCDYAASEMPMFNILVKYTAIADHCSLLLSCCEEDEDIVGMYFDTNNIFLLLLNASTLRGWLYFFCYLLLYTLLHSKLLNTLIC